MTPIGTSNKSSSTRGHLIVVEGLDRSGKTTQCQMLCEDIGGLDKDFKYIKFPDRTTSTGRVINAYLQGEAEHSDETMHLLFSANRWEAVQGMLRDLQAGHTIVVDRYAFSGAVYSAAKENPHLSLEWCWNPDIGLPQPDLVLFLDISSEDAAKRGGYGEERYEKQDMQVKVRALFKRLFARLPNLSVKIIDAGLPMQEVTDQIWQAYKELKEAGSSLEELQVLPTLQAP